MGKIIKTITTFFVSGFFLSDKVSAALLYGPPPENIAQPLYGIPSPYEIPEIPSAGIMDIAYWTLEKVLAFIVLPAVVVISVIIGAVIYIKRKRKAGNVTTNIQDGKA